VWQAHAHRQARQGPRAQHSGRRLYLVFCLRVLRETLSGGQEFRSIKKPGRQPGFLMKLRAFGEGQNHQGSHQKAPKRFHPNRSRWISVCPCVNSMRYVRVAGRQQPNETLPAFAQIGGRVQSRNLRQPCTAFVLSSLVAPIEMNPKSCSVTWFRIPLGSVEDSLPPLADGIPGGNKRENQRSVLSRDLCWYSSLP
jgi:hypothetical protein